MKAYLTWSNLNRTQSERDRSLFVRRGKKGRQATAAKFLLNPKSRKLHETMLRTVCETRVNRKKHSISIPILFDQSQGWSYSSYTDRGQSWRRSKIWNTLKIVCSFTPAISGRNLDSFFFSPGSLPSQSPPYSLTTTTTKRDTHVRWSIFTIMVLSGPDFLLAWALTRQNNLPFWFFDGEKKNCWEPKCNRNGSSTSLREGDKIWDVRWNHFSYALGLPQLLSLSLSLAIYPCSISLFLSLALFVQMQILS